MTAFRTRIRSVRFKTGGSVRVLMPRTERVHNELQRMAHIRVREIFDSHDKKCAGYVFLAWDTQGATSSSYFNSETSPYASSMIPDMAGELVRRAQTHGVVRDYLGFSSD